jgi:hypothetical protein
MAWLIEPLSPKYRNSEASMRTMTTSSFSGHGDRNRSRRDGLLSSLLFPAFSCSVPVISPCSFLLYWAAFPGFARFFGRFLNFFAPLYRNLQEPIRVSAQGCTPVHFTRTFAKRT